MSTTIIGFPRLGEFRELKFTTENTLEKKLQQKICWMLPKTCVQNTGTLSKKRHH